MTANDAEFDRMQEQLEELCMKPEPSAEERASADLLTKLINDYDDANFAVPETPPHKILNYLMEQRGLRESDLVSAIGSRPQVSDIVNGKRAISKTQAKKLAAFFHVSTDLFL